MCTCCVDFVGRRVVWWWKVSASALSSFKRHDRVDSFTVPVANRRCWWCFWTDLKCEGGNGELRKTVSFVPHYGHVLQSVLALGCARQSPHGWGMQAGCDYTQRATGPLPSHQLASGSRSVEHLQKPPQAPQLGGQPGRCQPSSLGWSGPFGARPWAGGPGAWGRARPAEGSVRPPLGRCEGEGEALRLPAVWSQSGKQTRNCGLSPFPQALHQARDQMTQSGLIILIAYS